MILGYAAICRQLCRHIVHTYDQCILVEDIGKFFSLFIAGTEEPFTARTVHVYVHIYDVEKTFIISDHAAWDTYIYVVLCSQAISAVLEMWLVS